MAEKAVYTHGHHSSVLSSHTWRTVKNSAAFLIPYLKPNLAILDIGHVTGVDYSHDVVDNAKAYAVERGVTNIAFQQADANHLPFPDASFDVVHCHQVLQHVADPVQVLREMRRVTRSGGIVAAREVDFTSIAWWPLLDGMDDWLNKYNAVARANGGDPAAGRKLHVWAKEAGYPAESLTLTAGAWCYATPQERAWWSTVWAERTLSSNFAPTALKHGIHTQESLEKTAEVWRKWGADEDGWWSCLHGELVSKV
ncbi:UbiE family methyltransferase [Epithele typhae]|uniref:UbiE family methyltransferase n=1 Tax=Epithele typhae TaxID=378194 RepID=UPI002008D478|nr:UbiE family methyltransferase [Epithele typhae]KAH9912860.1 UbiE family methyltransferase [Epithele typhae]